MLEGPSVDSSVQGAACSYSLTYSVASRSAFDGSAQNNGSTEEMEFSVLGSLVFSELRLWSRIGYAKCHSGSICCANVC